MHGSDIPNTAPLALTCDQTEAARFLRALDPKAAFFTFQTFDDDDTRKLEKLAKVLNGTLQKMWSQLVDLSGQGAGAFVTVNETNLQGREATDICRVRSLFIELDGVPLDPVLNDTEVPPPHMTVESSPGHWHVYWLVDGVPLNAFRALQKFLIRRFNADKRIHDLPRVLRLPGFPHQKVRKKTGTSPPFLSRIESINNAEPYDGQIFASLMANALVLDNSADGVDVIGDIDEPATDAEKLAANRERYADVDQEKIKAALEVVTADCSYDEWRNIGTVIRHGGLGLEVFDKWSASAKEHYTERSTAVQWKACRDMWEIGPGTLYRYANEQCSDWSRDYDQRQIDNAIALMIEAATEYRKNEQAKTEAKASAKADKPNDTNPWNERCNRRPPDDAQPYKPNDDATDDSAVGVDDDDEDDLSEETIGNIVWPVPVDLWGQLDPPELPLRLLPPIIEQLALIEGKHMGCDPAGLAIAALVVCAAAIPDQVKLQVKKYDDGWKESARFWGGLVGPPSSKKTPIINRVTWPLKEIDNELYHEFAAAMAAYERLTKDEQALQKPPRQQRVRLEDTTIEAAQQVFADSPQGLLCLQDELSGFFGMLDRYGGGSKDRGFWLQAYNGGSYLVNRIKRGTMLIENLSACMLGGIQPDVIRQLAGDGADDGLIQRLSPVIIGIATVGLDEPHDEVNLRYGSLVRSLHRMDIPNQPLVFSAAAQVIRRELEAKHMKLQACELINKQLAGTIGKYDGLFVRLCLIWQCIEAVDAENFPMTVNENTARRVADFLHQFLFGHACCFYLGMLAKADDHDRLSKVALYILAKKLVKIDNRTMARGNRVTRKMEKRDTETLLDQLDTFGWIARIRDTKGKITNIVNPRVHWLFEERGTREEERLKDARAMIAESVKLRRKG
jgi:hypothetical protein